MVLRFHGARATGAGGKRVSLLRAVEPRNERSINHFPLIRTRSPRYRLFRKEKRYDITIFEISKNESFRVPTNYNILVLVSEYIINVII